MAMAKEELKTKAKHVVVFVSNVFIFVYFYWYWKMKLYQEDLFRVFDFWTKGRKPVFSWYTIITI